MPPGPKPILEVGSGGGFLASVSDDVIASDVWPVPHVHVAARADALPFASGTLRAIVMTNVLHHVAHSEMFFADAARCIADEGAIVMVEPWLTSWSRLVYRALHHEPLRPDTADWDFPAGGPLSAANIALPWILFERDAARFRKRCAPWKVESIASLMPFSYLIAGGVTWPGLLPGWTYRGWRRVERRLLPEKRWAMFALIVLRKSR